MTTVGHTLAGLSIGVLCAPRGWRWPGRAAVLAAFALLANAPDIALFLTRPGTYDICHSILVNAAAMAPPLALLCLWRRGRRRIGGWPIVGGGAGAWFSHLILDGMYNTGVGVQVLWPINNTTSIVLSMPWFQQLRLPWGDNVAINIRTMGIELLFYGGGLALCLLLRRRLGRARRQIA